MNYVPDMPDKKEEEPVRFCDICNGDLYKGDEVYILCGDVICKPCLGDYFVHAVETL